MSLPYPWHSQVWQAVTAYGNGLPHALLLNGRKGLGKEEFAHFLANHLLCPRSGNQGPCGQCRSCHLVSVATHPDKKILVPQGNQLIIEQVHSLRQFLYQTAYFDRGCKVAIIVKAETMNKSAANAMLKILEEPPEYKYLLLVSNMPSLMLPTIRSRCINLYFKSVSALQFKQWLGKKTIGQNQLLYDISQGAPLYARKLMDSGNAELFTDFYKDLVRLVENDGDPLHLASHWQYLETGDMVDIMIYYVEKNIKNYTDNGQLYRLYDVLIERRRMIHSSLNLNKTLLLQECFILFYNLKISSKLAHIHPHNA